MRLAARASGSGEPRRKSSRARGQRLAVMIEQVGASGLRLGQQRALGAGEVAHLVGEGADRGVDVAAGQGLGVGFLRGRAVVGDPAAGADQHITHAVDARRAAFIRRIGEVMDAIGPAEDVALHPGPVEGIEKARVELRRGAAVAEIQVARQGVGRLELAREAEVGAALVLRHGTRGRDGNRPPQIAEIARHRHQVQDHV